MNLTSASDIFGKIRPDGPLILHGDPIEGLGKFMSFGLQMVFIFTGIFALIYMMWGAFKYITSGGDPEAVEKARSRINYALLGVIAMVVVLSVFTLITGNILGMIDFRGGFKIRLPTLDNTIRCSGRCIERKTETCRPRLEYESSDKTACGPLDPVNPKVCCLEY